MKKILFSLFLLLLISNSFLCGQNPIPLNYFRSPLGIDLSVTGSFGEIRPNHFHSGTDFQVQKKEGLPVFAIADGWVSRIKISPVGFGNALYIDHPNGFTSVYGHLMAYNDTIAQYAYQKQYANKSFEVDLFPANVKDSIWVRKGDLIAYAGNSGSSFGAHLHFEIRDTKTERIINPLLFGFTCQDNFKPYVDFIKIYPQDKESYVRNCNQPLKLGVSQIPSGEYHLTGNDTIDLWGNFGIGVQAFDYLYSSSDRNGWYNVKMYMDKALFFTMQLDSFAFSETRYINASLDYSDSYYTGSRIIQSVKLPGNELSLHQTGRENGIVAFTDNKYHEIVISVGDISGKLAVVRFIAHSIKPDVLISVPSSLIADTVLFFENQRENSFNTKDVSVILPKGSLFDDTWFSYSKLPRRKGTFSGRHQINQPEVPLKGKITLSIKADALPARLRSKALIARIDGDGEMHPAGGHYLNGSVNTETNFFDSYCIVADTTPPRIKMIRNKAKHKTSIQFTVTDNFSGVEKYYAEVNNKWALMQWDPKNDLMVYQFDGLLKKGMNKFRLTVIDDKGNKALYSTNLKK